MKDVGINISKDNIFGAANFIDSIAAIGFDSVFTCGNDEEFISFTADKCARLGLKYEYLHAPWGGVNSMWFDGEEGERVLKNFLLSVDLAEKYGIPMIISHVSSKEDAPRITDAGMRNFDRFFDYAAKKGITVAVENQRKLGNIATILEVYGKDTNVAFCWDVGHEKCFAHGREYLPLFADRCVATHIHDNNCVYNADEHLLPYDGQIDFRHTAELLHDYNYNGTLMLEIDLPKDGSDIYRDLSVEQFAAKAYAAVNRIRILSEY